MTHENAFKKQPLVTIDGLPQTGRSTLAQNLRTRFAADGQEMHVLDVGLLYRAVAAQMIKYGATDTEGLKKAVSHTLESFYYQVENKGELFLGAVPQEGMIDPQYNIWNVEYRHEQRMVKHLYTPEIEALTAKMTKNSAVYNMMKTFSNQLAKGFAERGAGAIIVGRGTGERFKWKADARIVTVSDWKTIDDGEGVNRAGMVRDVDVTRYLDIKKTIPELEEKGYIIAGSTTHRDARKPEAIADNVYKQLKNKTAIVQPAEAVEAQSIALEDTVSASTEIER